MVTAKQIEQFLAQLDFAVVGVSRNPKQFGHIVYKKLKENGLKVIPVNPMLRKLWAMSANRHQSLPNRLLP